MLKAVFTSNTDLHIPSPVRIAGVDVGRSPRCSEINGSPNAGLVVMKIDSERSADPRGRDRTDPFAHLPGGQLLRRSASGHARARRSSSSGATLPAANTSGPVQLDRVLSSLDSSARANLQKLVQGFGAALNKPGADEDQRAGARV